MRIQQTLFITIFLWLCPAVTMAYTLYLEDGTVIEEERLAGSPDYSHIHYGPVTVNFGAAKVKNIELGKRQPAVDRPLLSLVGVAEAATEPPEAVIGDYLSAFETVKQARKLNEIKAVVDPSYYAFLQQKVAAGAHELVVLEMVRSLLPDHLKVVNTKVDGQSAKVVSVGKSRLGQMHGVAVLTKQEERWQIKREAWVSDERLESQMIAPIALLETGQDLRVPHDPGKKPTLFKDNYYFDRNFLSLHKPPHGYRQKSAFMLYFYIRKEDKVVQKGAEVDKYADKDTKPDLHIAFSGPRSLIGEQKRYETEYPLDVSIAKDKDGYVPGTFNLHLPKRRPNAILSGFMLNF